MLRLLASVLIVTASLAGCSDSGGFATSICGVVLDDQIRPLEGATIKATKTHDSDEVLSTTTSDADAKFCFAGFPAGDYVLHVTKAGHREVSVSVTMPSEELVRVILPRS
jgi:hypothetical protein